MPTTTCPVCGACFESELSASLPFCSPRCRNMDLSNWLDEQYGLPVEDAEPDQTDEPSDNYDE